MKINITQEEFQKFFQEYELMHLLSHPNIVKTFGIFLSDETHPPSILLEFCPTNLDQKIKNEKLSKVDIVLIIYQIVEGMKYVHSQKVIHRDLKPTNILFGKDGFVKISDFGIYKLMSTENQSMTGGVGTQRFMAPEILNQEEYNEKVDVYSFGVVLFFILSGGEMPKITIIQVGTGKKAPIPSNINSIAKELINKCWNFDFNDRPSFNDILIYLEDNNFNLNELTECEINEAKFKINEHKAKIPSYKSYKI